MSEFLRRSKILRGATVCALGFGSLQLLSACSGPTAEQSQKRIKDMTALQRFDYDYARGDQRYAITLFADLCLGDGPYDPTNENAPSIVEQQDSGQIIVHPNASGATPLIFESPTPDKPLQPANEFTQGVLRDNRCKVDHYGD